MSITTNQAIALAAVAIVAFMLGKRAGTNTVAVQKSDMAQPGIWTWNGQ